MSYRYGAPEPALTPLDLYAAGYGICRHIDGVNWCWVRANPYGSGTCYGAPQGSVADAVDDARWVITGRNVGQMTLVGG
jgi:hypothetical protein